MLVPERQRDLALPHNQRDAPLQRKSAVVNVVVEVVFHAALPSIHLAGCDCLDVCLHYSDNVAGRFGTIVDHPRHTDVNSVLKLVTSPDTIPGENASHS